MLPFFQHCFQRGKKKTIYKSVKWNFLQQRFHFHFIHNLFFWRMDFMACRHEASTLRSFHERWRHFVNLDLGWTNQMFSSWFSSLQFLGWTTSSPCRRTHSTICKHGALRNRAQSSFCCCCTVVPHSALMVVSEFPATFALRKKEIKNKSERNAHTGDGGFIVFEFSIFFSELSNKLSLNTEGLCFSRLSPPAHTREYATAAARFWENLSHYYAGLLHPWWSSSELFPWMK